MGKGDKKSKKGKRWRGSYGNSRKRSQIKARKKRNIAVKPLVIAVEAVVEVKPKAKRTTKKKAETV